MRLSKAQLSLWWREWARACTAQGWTRENGWTSAAVDDQRHAILREFGHETLHTVDNRAFDRILARVRTLQSRLDGAVDEVRPQNGDARRLLWRIEWLIKCIEVYRPGQGEAYVAGVVQDKFPGTDKYGTGIIHARHWRDLSAARSPGREDSELDHLRFTLTARLNGVHGMRAAEGHSVHEMCSLANVTCACETCKLARQAAKRGGSASPAQPARKPISRPRPKAKEPVAAGETRDPDPF